MYRKSFQEIILKLQVFWLNKGCSLMQPYDMEMGAGTFHPATFLYSIGPEPCKTAYVQPSRRPTDGRYGQNTNRLQHYFQFQVLLKPSPDDILDLYLESIESIGISTRDTDIRFVEDNWKSPTLGAWGIGWEVWINGMEATQFTYFQQVGGMACQPISGEITYGLERLAMYVQEVDNVFDLVWSYQDDNPIKYGDIYKQNEIEQSAYNFNEADTKYLFKLMHFLEKECLHLIEKKLVIPAYEKVLKSSHTFNLLDARNVISISERQAYILKIRTLAVKVAKAYYAQRKDMGFPMLKQ